MKMTHPTPKNSRGSNGSNGSMTMAMQAARNASAASDGPKVLRVGLIESTRITEERVFRGTETVTIGRDPKCTFAPLVSESDDCPEKSSLFVWRNNGWVLVFSAKREGRVVVGDRMSTLAQLIQAGHATPCAEGYEYALTENSRGKISFGSTSVLFQFVEPPPVATKPQLPSAIRSRPLRGMDWSYNACVSGFLAVAFCGLGYMEVGYDPIVETLSIAEEIRMVHLAVAPAEEPTPPVDPQQATAAPDAPVTPTNNHNTAANTTRNPTTPRRTPQQTQEDLAERALRQAITASDVAMNGLQRSADFRALAAAGMGPHSATAIIENGQGLLDSSVASLQNVSGIRNPDGNFQGINRTGIVASNTNGNNSLGNTRHIDGPGTEIGSAPVVTRERIVVSRITSETPELPPSDPTMPMDDVARIFRRNIGAIQACYTAGLRDNPGLRGRVVIEFTIGTTGRVVGTPSVGGLDNAERVHQCMAARVRGYVFPVLAERAEVSFPVNVTPGN